MENKKISLSFGIVVVAFLVIFYILINNFNNNRVSDYKDYAVTIASVVKHKNDKIRFFAYRLALVQKENEDLKNTLADTRNSLDALSKRLAPALLPASANEPVPATVPAPVAATK